MASAALASISAAISTRAARLLVVAIVSSVYSAVFVFSLGSGAYGPGVSIRWPPRSAFLTAYMLWVGILRWQATRCGRGASTEIQAKGWGHYGKSQFHKRG
jgi:hypothetical protein